MEDEEEKEMKRTSFGSLSVVKGIRKLPSLLTMDCCSLSGSDRTSSRLGVKNEYVMMINLKR
jgi:hypothetical protein